MRDGPQYLRVFLTFARNSLVRDMTFRANFLIETSRSLCWMLMNLGFYVLIFAHTPYIGAGLGLGQVRVLRVSVHDAVRSTAWCRPSSCRTSRSSAS